MEDSSVIETSGMDGSPIVVGSVVRYIRTGTVGKVIDIKEDEGGVWVLVDASGLYYKPETLVIADASELKEERVVSSSVKDAESYLRTYVAEDGKTVDIGQVTGGG